jgi:prevent-host-death family protein
MRTINIHQAKTNLSKLLSDVELGEEIIIANRGVPIAKLIPFHQASARRASLGQDRGRFVVPENFNDSLPEDILAGFEGDEA